MEPSSAVTENLICFAKLESTRLWLPNFQSLRPTSGSLSEASFALMFSFLNQRCSSCRWESEILFSMRCGRRNFLSWLVKFFFLKFVISNYFFIFNSEPNLRKLGVQERRESVCRRFQLRTSRSNWNWLLLGSLGMCFLGFYGRSVERVLRDENSKSSFFEPFVRWRARVDGEYFQKF